MITMIKDIGGAKVDNSKNEIGRKDTKREVKLVLMLSYKESNNNRNKNHSW